jgi:hypothetical protein
MKVTLCVFSLFFLMPMDTVLAAATASPVAAAKGVASGLRAYFGQLQASGADVFSPEIAGVIGPVVRDAAGQFVMEDKARFAVDPLLARFRGLQQIERFLVMRRSRDFQLSDRFLRLS